MEPQKLQEYIEAIGRAFSPLAEKIGQGGAALFGWAVRRNYALGIWDLLVFLVWGAIVIKLFRLYPRWRQWSEGDGDRQFFTIFPLILGGIPLTVGALACLRSALERLIAPEFSTLQDVVGMFK